jgi:lipoprotein-releasing system ATP-binding protein
VAALLETQNVSAAKPGGATLKDLSLTIQQGGINILAGDAGCGKNLLLRLFSLLERPERGEVFVEGAPTVELNDEERAAVRNRRFGFVFTAPFLLGGFSAIENVAMPLFRISHVDPEPARRRSESLLDFVGLRHAAEIRVDELRGCDQFRVALARALINEPTVLFIEDLDREEEQRGSGGFHDLLRESCARFGTTVLATAAREFTPGLYDRRIVLCAGSIESDQCGAEPMNA